MDAELAAWFEREGMMRYAVIGEEGAEPLLLERGPVVALGPADDDYVQPPHPAATGYHGKPLAAMDLDDYNAFLFHWLEAAAAVGDVRCVQCGRLIVSGDDLPDRETWDAILIEQEIVAWMLVHFDCKKALARKVKGLTPFDLTPGEPPRYDLSRVEPPANAEVRDGAAP